MRDMRDPPPPATGAHIFERVLRYAGFALFELSLVMSPWHPLVDR